MHPHWCKERERQRTGFRHGILFLYYYFCFFFCSYFLFALEFLHCSCYSQLSFLFVLLLLFLIILLFSYCISHLEVIFFLSIQYHPFLQPLSLSLLVSLCFFTTTLSPFFFSLLLKVCAYRLFILFINSLLSWFVSFFFSSDITFVYQYNK